MTGQELNALADRCEKSAADAVAFYYKVIDAKRSVQNLNENIDRANTFFSAAANLRQLADRSTMQI